MPDIRFYHLTQRTIDQALPEILGKGLERKLRIVVVADNDQQLSHLDQHLWTYHPNSFLPHGFVKDGFEGDQPIWLTTDFDNPNQAKMLVLLSGVAVDKVEDLDQYDLVCHMFEDRNSDAVDATRAIWKTYKDADLTPTYWQQTESGGWQKAA